MVVGVARKAEFNPSRPERNPERTRQRILDAARTAFCAHGVEGTTMEAIARDSSVNKRMVYHYFGKKEDLYLKVLEDTYAARRHHDGILDLRDCDPEEGVRRMIRQAFAYCRDNPDYVNLLIVENLNGARHLRRSEVILRMHKPLVEGLRDVLRRGSELGLFRAFVDPVQLYLTIASLCFFYFSNNATLSTIFDRDFSSAEALEAREAHVEAVVLGFLKPRSEEERRAGRRRGRVK